MGWSFIVIDVCAVLVMLVAWPLMSDKSFVIEIHKGERRDDGRKNR